MVPRSEQLKAELIERLALRAREAAPAELRDVAERSVRQLYAHVPAEDLLADRPEDLWGAAIALWRFAQERALATAKVRVYHPRLEEHGWESPHTIVEIVNDDMPFLVDSVTAELARSEAEVHLVVHPVMRVERDTEGRLLAVHDPEAPPEGASAESVMHVRITAQPAERQEEIRAALEGVLAEVRAAVADWRTMRDRCRALIGELERRPPPLPAEEVEEGHAFLAWLDDHHFTYLGYREYAFEGEGEAAIARVLPASGCGVLRDEQTTVFHGLRSLGSLPPEVRQFLRQPELLSITKANRLSKVHRAVHMDAIAVKCFDPAGRVTGMRLIVGLFTAAAYSSSTRSIPFLRQKVEKVLTRADFAPGSHDAKSLRHILEVYPRDQLFQIGDEDLFRIAMGYLNLQQRQRIALFVRRDPFERFVSAQVLVPRDRFDSELRPKFQAILEEAYQGRVGAVETYLTEDAFARLHFIIDTTPGAIPVVDTDAVEERLIETGRSWTDRLVRELVGARGEEEGVALAQRWGKAFPPSYQERFAVPAALEDIAYLERALADGFTMNLYRPAGAAPHELRLKIYTCGPSVPLSDLLPMLEAMGLRVNDEVPFALRAEGDEDCGLWIRDLELVSEDGAAVPLDEVRDAFHEAFAEVWRGAIEGDGFNKLVIKAKLVAREVNVLRAYCKYLRQARIPFSQFYMQQTLAKSPEVARLLVELFEVRFDPAREKAEREARARSIVAEIERLLDAVANLDEDRILRRYLNVVEATLRTNYYQRAEGGGPKPYLSFKLDSRRIEELPLPRPFREIFIYSPRVEAAHLRGGKVARGGIRWSDRREDFRTEVLGLMKAQMVKNAVIVPVGSKGGFVVKRQPPQEAGREKLMAEVVDCYKTMMRGLLDLTDNLRGQEVVPPPDVVRRDDDDPYLVVAADKGTASFSDIANARLRRVRLLARRRLRLRRLGRLRPQEDGDHLARRLGVGQAPLPRAGQGRRERGLHRRRRRRHVGRRLRQRHAALAAHQAARRLRPPPRLRRSRPRPGGELRRAAAPLRAAALLLGRLRRQADRARRRRLRAQRQVDRRHPRDAQPLRRPRSRGGDPGRADPGDPQGPGRAALVRRHRHLRQGAPREPRRRRRPRQRRPAGGRRRPAREGGRRGREPRHDAARPHRVRAPRRRPPQHRLDRQLRRRRLLRPRGQHQDPARRRRARRRHDAPRAQRAAGRHDRGGGGAGAARQLPADPGAHRHPPDRGAPARPPRPLHARAREGRPSRPPPRVPAGRRDAGLARSPRGSA